jgi:hypothetical protein
VPLPAPTALSWRSPALWVVAIAAFASIAISVSYRIDDPDLWQHLAVGREVWTTHRLPMVHHWTWPSYGQPDVNPSWGFETLLWPFWDRGRLLGLFAWRWLTTLAAFALLWAAARRMGAKGLAPALVLAFCALTYRQRSDLRPETLSAVLFAAQLWILETRRGGGPDRSAWLPALAWIWANSHVSYYLGLATTALYLAEAWWVARSRPAGGPAGRGAAGGARGRGAAAEAVGPRAAPAGPLAWALLASIAISFLNPYGWRSLAQPFQYVLFWRHQPVFQNIPELAAPRWSQNWTNGLPLLMAGWPALALWRAARRRPDRVELVLAAAFTAQALTAQRFLGAYTLGAAPFVSRDLGELAASLRAGRRAWPLALRAGLVAIGCLAIGPLEWSRWDLPTRLTLDEQAYAFRACDFLAAHGVRGRGLNQFGMSGWQVFRFAPDRGRLPFIDIHQSGTRADCDLYALAQSDPAAWRALDERHRFDYVLLGRVQFAGDRLLDALDADTAFALVFKDDAAALFVRRGSFPALARRYAYTVVPAGNRGIGALGQACARDSTLRPGVRAELEREAAGSPWHAQACSLLANLALLESDWPRATALLDSVEAIDLRRPRLYLRFGLLALQAGRPREALARFAREREIHGGSLELDLAEARAWAALGRAGSARAAWRRALERDPANAEAADSLAAWERRG